MNLSFELGPIRPPSEARSLLLRFTRNCPWNKCAFCRTYKGEKFSRRTVDEIKKDIDTVNKISLKIKEISQEMGYEGKVSRKVLFHIYRSSESMFHVASWLYYGGKTVFIQDANSMVMKTADLVETIGYLRASLPSVVRVTIYARSNTLLRKSVEELAEIKQAGLSRIHVGMESGCDQVLEFMDKGVTAEQHVSAGRHVKEAGISLCEYVILGLGGRRWAVEHPVETAEVLNAIDPDYIRMRSLAVVKGTPLYEKMLKNEFEELPDEETALGERLLIEHLQGINSCLISDHSLNLLEEVNGKLPEEKKSMLSVIDRFLNLPEGERQNFVLGKRIGMYRSLVDMLDFSRYIQVEAELKRLNREGRLSDMLSSLKERLIV